MESINMSGKRLKKYIAGKWNDCFLSDHYIYLNYHDEGGYGVVYLVYDKASGEKLILKRATKSDFRALGDRRPMAASEVSGPVMHTEALFMDRCARVLDGLKVRSYYDDDDHYILVMEHGGRSLHSIAAAHRKKVASLLRHATHSRNLFFHVYLSRVKKYLAQTCALARRLYDSGVHHNDLKLENVVVNEHDIVSLIDFGVAREICDCYTTFTGTLEYIPPEFETEGRYRPWDHTVWCFGVMLHYMCLAKYPFSNINRVLETDLIRKLPVSFADLICACLSNTPETRPKNLYARLENLHSEW